MKKRLLLPFVIIAGLAVLAASLGDGAAATAPSQEFFDETAFLEASGATLRVSFPEGLAPTAVPYVENGVTLVHPSGWQENTIGEFTPLLPGNDFVTDSEDVDITLDSPILAFGIRIQDGFMVGCVDGAAYPDLQYPDCSATAGLDSSFTFSFLSGVTEVYSMTVDPPVDQAFFVGLVSTSSFDRVEIREVVSQSENDFFGAIFTDAFSGTSTPTPTDTDTPTPTATDTPTETPTPTDTPTPTATATDTPTPTNTPTPTPAIPDVPTQLSPPEGARLRTGRPTLDWADSTSATFYRVQVYRFGQLIIDTTTPVSNYRTPSLPRAGSQYGWRVQACNATGCSAWTVFWRFILVG